MCSDSLHLIIANGRCSLAVLDQGPIDTPSPLVIQACTEAHHFS
jgi:hypothetical protein